ncbi:MAG: hypothetical protein M3Z00_13505, partial [Actinomycetota bacterium]|nr:hypothetical protein [Actinomycetota bacterium]
AASSEAASTRAPGLSSATPAARPCSWPQLSPGADAQAKKILGGLVGPHRTLVAGCAVNRLQGGSFPAVDHLGLAVTVEVTKRAAGVHSCMPRGCVSIGSGAYAIDTASSTTIQVDGATHQVVVRAPAKLKIPRDRLLAFAVAVDRLDG